MQLSGCLLKGKKKNLIDSQEDFIIRRFRTKCNSLGPQHYFLITRRASLSSSFSSSSPRFIEIGIMVIRRDAGSALHFHLESITPSFSWFWFILSVACNLAIGYLGKPIYFLIVWKCIVFFQPNLPNKLERIKERSAGRVRNLSSLWNK